ncbi:MAG: hypothetical protein ACYSWX_16825, partial [Planctomycetota bacterium]
AVEHLVPEDLAPHRIETVVTGVRRVLLEHLADLGAQGVDRLARERAFQEAVTVLLDRASLGMVDVVDEPVVVLILLDHGAQAGAEDG